jgi:hypothetical protein
MKENPNDPARGCSLDGQKVSCEKVFAAGRRGELKSLALSTTGLGGGDEGALIGAMRLAKGQSRHSRSSYYRWRSGYGTGISIDGKIVTEGIDEPGYFEEVVSNQVEYVMTISRGGDGVSNAGSTPQPQSNSNIQNKLTKFDCDNIHKILDREARFGTAVAAMRSAIFMGDGAAANPVRGKGANYLTKFGELDLEWFSVLSASWMKPLTHSGPLNTPDILKTSAVYAGGKNLWTILRGGAKAIGASKLNVTNGYPFKDPGERTAVTLAGAGAAYAEIFDDEFMRTNCPPSITMPWIHDALRQIKNKR